jgi:hypothetical protein
MERASRRSPLAVAFAVLGVGIVLAGIAMTFFGVGAELARTRTVVFHVRARVPDKRIADLPKPGDVLFSDTAGIRVGEIVSTEVTHAVMAVGDKQGGVHLNADPVTWQLEAVIKARGRMGDGMVLLDTQVLQVGQSFSVISRRYYLPNTTVVSIDVE